jgi:hypothetical protein
MGHPEYYGLDLEVDTTRPFTVVTRKQPPTMTLFEPSRGDTSDKMTCGWPSRVALSFSFPCCFSTVRLEPHSGFLIPLLGPSCFSIALTADAEMLQNSPLMRAVSSPLSDASIFRTEQRSKCPPRRWRVFQHRTFWITSIVMQQAQISTWIWEQRREWARL